MFAFHTLWKHIYLSRQLSVKTKQFDLFLHSFLLSLFSFFFHFFLFCVHIRKCFIFKADIDTHVWICNRYDYKESRSNECLRKNNHNIDPVVSEKILLEKFVNVDKHRLFLTNLRDLKLFRAIYIFFKYQNTYG